MLHLVSPFEHILCFTAWSAPGVSEFLYLQELTANYSGDTHSNACKQWAKVKDAKVKGSVAAVITLRDQLIGHKIFVLSKSGGHQSASYPLVLRFGKSVRLTTIQVQTQYQEHTM